jgi:hypothetical protein
MGPPSSDHGSKLGSGRIIKAVFLHVGDSFVKCWHSIVTLDESWFYLPTDHEIIWLQSDEKVP